MLAAVIGAFQLFGIDLCLPDKLVGFIFAHRYNGGRGIAAVCKDRAQVCDTLSHAAAPVVRLRELAWLCG